jgi:hypothetical protein
MMIKVTLIAPIMWLSNYPYCHVYVGLAKDIQRDQKRDVRT